MDPARAREDPVVVKNVPYFKAKKALEAEVMKLDAPPRPQNWGVHIILFWTWMFTLLQFSFNLFTENNHP